MQISDQRLRTLTGEHALKSRRVCVPIGASNPGASSAKAAQYSAARSSLASLGEQPTMIALRLRASWLRAYVPRRFDHSRDACASLGCRIDEPALRGQVRDRDQLGVRTDRALERREVELPGHVDVDHVAYAFGFWMKNEPFAISVATVSSAPIPAVRVEAMRHARSEFDGLFPALHLAVSSGG
jgi:hypothetical protein